MGTLHSTLWYKSHEMSIEHPRGGLASLAQLINLFQVDGSVRPEHSTEMAIFISWNES